MSDEPESKETIAERMFLAVADLFLLEDFPYRYSRNDIVEWGRMTGVISDDEHAFIQQHFPGSMFEFYPVED